MATIHRARTIAAQPQAVWDVLADFGTISSWAADVDHSCILEHGPGVDLVGSSRRVQIGRNTLVERITEFQPPTSLGYTIEGLPRQLRHVHAVWQVMPAGSATKVTLTSTIEIGPNPLQRLIARGLCSVMAKKSDLILAGLARRTECSDA